MVDKVALGQVFSEYLGFPSQFSFHRLLHIHHHLSSGAGAIDQLVADVPSGFSLTPPQESKKKLTKLLLRFVSVSTQQLSEAQFSSLKMYVNVYFLMMAL
jgi:fatty acid desaturase